MNVFAIKWRDEALIQFGDDGMGGAVGLVLDGLYLLDPHFQIVRVLQYTPQQLRALRQVSGKLRK